MAFKTLDQPTAAAAAYAGEGKRTELARTAACEISQIIDALDRSIEQRGFDPNLWRGMYLRLDTLAAAIMDATGDPMRETEEIAREVFGVKGVAHV